MKTQTLTKKVFFGIFASLPVVSLILLSGCKASPKPDSGFLDNPEKMKPVEGIPLHRVWKDPKTSIKDYDKIIVKPVFTKKQLEKTTLEKTNIHTWLSKEDKNVAAYAKYMKDAFKKAIKKSKKFKLVDKVGPKTMVLELSLVKMVPGKPVVGAITNLGRLTPIGLIISPLTMTVSGTTDSPMQSSVAIEGRIMDAKTGNAIAMFADRRKQKTAYFNTKDFRPHGNPEQIADELAADFVEILEKRPGETGKKIEGSGSINAVNF